MALAGCGASDGRPSGAPAPSAYCSAAPAATAAFANAARSAEGLAAARGDLAALRRWQASGQPAPVEENGMTLLHWAALMGHTEAAAFLLAAGADPNARDGFGDTPLTSALVGCHADVIRLLMARGADPERRNIRGDRAYDMARRAGATELLPLLRR